MVSERWVSSEKYLRSVYCMRELLHLFNASLGEREVFMRKLVPPSPL